MTQLDVAKNSLKVHLSLDDFNIHDLWSECGNSEFEYLAFNKNNDEI